MMEASDGRAQEADVTPDHGATLRVSGMVGVERRAWPGINKPGGIGRVTKLHTQQETDGRSTVTHVDVHYVVLGGRERNIPVRYVKAKPDYDAEQSAAPEPTMGRARNNLRDRSMLLGRCKRCGSLRMDCGSCDWIAEEKAAEKDKHRPTNKPESQRAKSKRRRVRVQQQNLDDSSSSSSDESLLMLIQRLRNQKSRRQRMKRRLLDSESSSDSSSSSDESDPFLSNLSSTRRTSSKRAKQQGQAYSKRAKQQQTRVMGTGNSALEHLEGSESDTDPIPTPPRKENASPSYSESDSKSRSSSLCSVQAHQPPGFMENVWGPDTTPSRPSSVLMSQDDESPPTDGSSRETPQSQGPIHLDDFMQSLDDFIQPEGTKVAENLPEDTEDKTASISYGDLPAFFDRTAAQLEASLPRNKTFVVRLQKRLDEAQSIYGDDRRDELRKIETDSSKLYKELKQQLIREGTDQCQRAICRMGDRTERRKHKHKLTKEQMKQCKGSALDMREIRMDSLGQEAESIMRDLRQILHATGSSGTQAALSDEEFNSSDEIHDNSVDMNTQDLKAAEPGSSQDSFAAADDASFPPFDPHMHASRVKHKSRKREKKCHHESNGAKRARKAARGASDDHVRNRKRSRAVGAQRRRRDRKERRLRQTSASEEEYSQHANCSDSSSESILFHSAAREKDTGPRANSNGEPDGRASSIPSLESILSRDNSGTTAFVGDDCEAGTAISANNGPRIADRMQAFLDSNMSNINGEPWVAPPTPHRTTIGKSSRRKKSRRSHQTGLRTLSRSQCSRPRVSVSDHLSTRQSQLSSEDVESGDDEEASVTRHLYRQILRRRGQQPPQEQPAPVGDRRSTSDLCSIMAKSYPSALSLCWKALSEILHRFTNSAEEQEFRAAEIFGSVLELLQTHGNATLQEILHLNGGFLQTHIRLLTNVLVLLERKAHRSLKPDDGLVYKVFKPTGVCPFVEMVGLQVLDIVYSQLLPTAWSLSNNRRIEVLGLLSPLRDVLCRITPMIETVSGFVTNKLECQQWWKAENGSSSYVSSVNPYEYASFLTTGDLPTTPSEKIRFTMFKGTLPRCEIDAVWSLFAYFAGTQLRGIIPETAIRWRLLLVLLFSKAAVLGTEALTPAKADAEPILAPSGDHISCCEREMGYLSSLLSVGAMDPLPSTDGFVVKLVQKAFALQADQYKFDPKTSELLFPPIPTKNDFRSIMRIWDGTSLHEPLTTLPANDDCFTFTEISASFDLYAGNEKPCRFASLLPTSAILRRSVFVLVSWVQRMPKKKARWSRLNEKLQQLISSLEGKAQCIEQERNAGETEATSNVSNSFEDAFFSSGEKSSTVSALQPELLYREGAAHMMIALATAEVVCKEPGSASTLPCAPFTKMLREKVWNTLSDEAMRERRRFIVGETNQLLSKPPEYVGDALRLYISARTLGLLTLSHLGFPTLDIDCSDFSANFSWQLHPDIVSGDNAFVFLVSCMISCLDCACDLLDNANHRNSRLNFPNASMEPAELFSRIIACICIWLEKIFTRSRFILAISKRSPHSAISKLREPIENLGKVALAMSTNSLTRSIQSTMEVTGSGIDLQLCFRACLATLRSALGLASESDIQGSHTNSADQGAGESSRSDTTDITQSESMGQRNDNEEFFGDLDDNIFLDIDLNGNAGVGCDNRATQSLNDCPHSTSQELERSAVSSLWPFLSGLLDLSMPSKRFAILPQTSGSVAGRSLVARHAGAICSCLATLCIWDLTNNCSFKSSLESLMRCTTAAGHAFGGDDQSYMKQVSQCFSSELCHLSQRFPPCMRTLRAYLPDVVFHFVEAMLDSDTLERFPSWNVANGGSRREKKELVRLKLTVNEQIEAAPQTDVLNHPDVEGRGLRRKTSEVADGLGHCYTSQNLWSFCRVLGIAINRLYSDSFSDESSSCIMAAIGKILLQSDCDLASLPEEHYCPPSLERECLKRLKKLRGIISATARFHGRHATLSPPAPLNFERVSSIVLASSAHQLVRVSEGFRYYDHSFNDAHRPSGRVEGQAETHEPSAEAAREKHKYEKLLELQSCYVELTITLLSWILRESAQCSKSFKTWLRHHVSDYFFSPVLQRQAVDVHATLQKLCLVAHPGRTANISTTSSVSTGSDSSSGQNHMLDAMYKAVLRRARELMLYVAMSYTPGEAVRLPVIFTALMVAGTESVEFTENIKEADYLAWVVGHSFHCLERSPSSFTSKSVTTACGHFQKAIDEYLPFVDVSREHASQDVTAVHKIRQFALHQYLLSKLKQEGKEMAKKKGVIQVLKHLLGLESKCQTMGNDESTVKMDSFTACSFAKGLHTCLCQLIQQSNIDNGMFCDLFDCATHILSFPASSNGGGIANTEGGSFLHWSMSNSTSMAMLRDPSGRAASSNVLCATYIGTFATWLKCLAELLTDQGTGENTSLQAFRWKAMELKNQGKSKWTDSSELDSINGSPQLKILLKNGALLEELDRLVFSGKENVPSVRNVYSKQKKNATSGSTDAESRERLWTPSKKVSSAAHAFLRLFTSLR